MEGETKRQESVSDFPEEPPLRSIPISVKASTLSRSNSVAASRRGSSVFTSPSGSGRRESASSSGGAGSLGESRGRSGSVVGQWVKSTLYLTETMLYYEAMGQVCIVLLEDLIGVQILPQPPRNNPNACEFDINYYPKITSRGGEKKTRKLMTAMLQFDSEPVFKENLLQSVDWKKAINIQTQRALKKIFCNADVHSLQLGEDESTFVPRHLLVFLNPVSGAGKTVSDFKQHVQPLFDLAEIHYHLIVTAKQNHAREIMKTYDVMSIHGIVVASGDGLLYEVVNGIMEREDWESAIKVPIGMLPTGSGNALVASSLYESGEEFNLLNAAFQIIRGGVLPLDVATVETGDGGKCYMSLLSNWGLVADCDIESEKFRKIGETRFVLGTLNCIIKRRIYRGKLSYLKSESESREESVTQVSQDSDSQEQPEKPQLEGIDSSPKRDMSVTVEVNEENEKEEVDLLPTDTPTTTDQTGTNTDTPPPSSQVTNATPQESETASSDSSDPSNQERNEQPQTTMNNGVQQFGPKADLLVPLSEPVPSSWEVEEGEFVCITILMIPHMAHKVFGDPMFNVGTGKFRIVIIEGHVSRLGMLNIMTKTDSGAHVNLDGVVRREAMAFRLEPYTAPGILTVDGEAVHYGPMQCQIHPALARVMCRKRQV